MDPAADTAIASLKSTTFSGRRLTRRQIAEVRDIVAFLPGSSRHELCRLVCEALNWTSDRGDLRVGACLAMLERLEAHGILRLPPRVEGKRRRMDGRPVWSRASDPQPEIAGPLAELRPLRLEPAGDAESRQLWNALVDRHHYLGYKRPFGSHVRYLLRDRRGRALGCLLFDSSTKSLPCRDRWIGWSERRRNRARHLVLCNSRFLVLPWVRVRNLASAALGMAARQLPGDWESRFGTRPLLVETFVDAERFRASCYRAANWRRIGETSGGRKPVKSVYVMPLDPDCRALLRGGRPDPKPEPAPSAARDTRCARTWRDIAGIAAGVAARHDRTWQKRRRVFGTLLVILFVFRLVLSGRGYRTTLCELWEQCRDSGIPLPQPEPPAASSAAAAREKLDEAVFKTLHREILARHAGAARAAGWKGRAVFAVDGSKVNLPRPLADFGYGTPHPNARCPQGMVSALHRLHDRVPVDFDLHAHGNERLAALDHLDHVGEGDVVVYDRGYFSYEFLRFHRLRGVHCVFRVAERVNPEFDGFIASGEAERTVALGPPRDAPAVLRGTSHRVRLVRYTAGDTEFRLATTLLDGGRYPVRALSDLYHGRWGVEELYKSTKGLLGEFHARSERGVRQELYAAFTLVALARLFAGHAEAGLGRGGDPLAPMRANGRNALRLVGRSIERMFLTANAMVADTVAALLSGIRRCVQRERPNRSHDRISRRPRSKWARAAAN